MRHVEKAINDYSKLYGENPFISIENIEDDPEVPPKVTFTIQSAPIGEVGVNGVQFLDIIKYSLCLLRSLNEEFPCRENAISITKLEEVIHRQEDRTQDRTLRKVEGTNQQ